MEINQITEAVIGKAIQVHRNLGSGLLESANKEYLYYELTEAGLNVEKEKAMPLVYQKVKLECGYRVDLFVENQIIVELKAVEFLNDVHLAQTLTYLKIANRQTGLSINFNVSKLTDGIKRVYNKYYFKE